ncbi:MAG: signal peptidase I [bacterium]
MSSKKKEKKPKSKLRNWTETLIWSLAVALILRQFVVQAYRIPSGSMEDTLLIGDFLLAEKITYRFRDPRPGEIVIFKYPLNPSKDFVKRCIAVEGQTVYIKDKIVFVDGKPFNESPGVKFTDPNVLPSTLSQRDNFGPLKLQKGEFFVMGDNRDNSFDCRFWGPLKREFIIGKPMFIYFSWSPTPSGPSWEPPYLISLIRIFFWDLFHIPSKVRFTRITKLIR